MEKCQRRSYGDVGDDRISTLPEEILTHIMSFMHTEDAVKLSSLSKRWRHLWTHVPVIAIEDRPSNGPAHGATHRFMKFVDRVLSLNQVSCLEKFTLACDYQYDMEIARKWIQTAFKREIVSLSLEFWYGLAEFEPVEVDLNELIRSKKLIKLNLRHNIALFAAPGLYFPSLKTVVLHFVNTLGDLSLAMILESCPVLEELLIDRDDIDDCLDTLSVKSSSLKKLRVHTRRRVADHTISLKIDAKNLEEIDLNIALPTLFESSDLPSLVTSNLKISEARLNTTFEILRKISNTRRLVFNMNVICDFGHDSLLTFRYLADLVMEINKTTWPFLPHILERSPNLISLTLAKVSHCSESKCRQLFRSPECSMSCLEKMVLYGFQCCSHEMEIIKYLMENSPILKKMSFRFSASFPQRKHEFCNQLFARFKSWNDCEIEIF